MASQPAASQQPARAGGAGYGVNPGCPSRKPRLHAALPRRRVGFVTGIDEAHRDGDVPAHCINRHPQAGHNGFVSNFGICRWQQRVCQLLDRDPAPSYHLLPAFTSVSSTPPFFLHTSTQYIHPALHCRHARPGELRNSSAAHPQHACKGKHRQPHLSSPANCGQRQPNICPLRPWSVSLSSRRSTPSGCGNGPSSGLHKLPGTNNDSSHLAA